MFLASGENADLRRHHADLRRKCKHYCISSAFIRVQSATVRDLVRDKILVSVPPGTEMFYFPGSARAKRASYKSVKFVKFIK